MYFAEEFDKRIKALHWYEIDRGDKNKHYKKNISLGGQTVIIQNGERKVMPPKTIEVVIEYTEGSMYEENNGECKEVSLCGFSIENGYSEYFCSIDDLINSIQNKFK